GGVSGEAFRVVGGRLRLDGDELDLHPESLLAGAEVLNDQPPVQVVDDAVDETTGRALVGADDPLLAPRLVSRLLLDVEAVFRPFGCRQRSGKAAELTARTGALLLLLWARPGAARLAVNRLVGGLVRVLDMQRAVRALLDGGNALGPGVRAGGKGDGATTGATGLRLLALGSRLVDRDTRIGLLVRPAGEIPGAADAGRAVLVRGELSGAMVRLRLGLRGGLATRGGDVDRRSDDRRIGSGDALRRQRLAVAGVRRLVREGRGVLGRADAGRAVGVVAVAARHTGRHGHRAVARPGERGAVRLQG